MDTQKKWVVPLMIWVVFETVAVTLWLTKDNLFYLFNFSYIGSAIAIGFFYFSFIISMPEGLSSFLWDCIC